MLIFQPHLPHIITNSWRPLHDLSPPEPFEKYTASEGSVSISTCDLVDVDSASTDEPNASEYVGL